MVPVAYSLCWDRVSRLKSAQDSISCFLLSWATMAMCRVRFTLSQHPSPDTHASNAD